MLAPHEERLAEQLAVQEEPSAPSARVGDGEREVLRNLFTLLSVHTRGWTADDWTHLASPESLSIWSGDDEVMKVVARPSESREVPYCEAWEYDVVEYVQRQRCERCHGVAGGREEARQVTSPTSTFSPLSLLPHPSTHLPTPHTLHYTHQPCRPTPQPSPTSTARLPSSRRPSSPTNTPRSRRAWATCTSSLA